MSSQDGPWYETQLSGNVPFYLEDEYGRAEVYPEGAELFPLKKETYTNSGGFYTQGIQCMVPVGAEMGGGDYFR